MRGAMTADAHSEGRRAAAVPRDVGARLMLVLLCLIWGVTWPVMKIALEQIPPLGMRAMTAALGALTLLAICLVQRRSLRIPDARAWAHVVTGSILNIVGFSVLIAFAQNAAATSRVAIVTYTLPVWTVLLAWLVLGERPSRVQGVAMVLCAIGLGVLIWPLARAGVPLGLVFAAGSGLSWAAGTVYLKWARIDADPMGVAAWQVSISFLIIAACALIFEGAPRLQAIHVDALLAVAFTGFIGNGAAYALWFSVVPRLPAATSSLGVLGAPVIGVASSIMILGERPTATDLLGFALILAASACVLLWAPTRTGDGDVATPPRAAALARRSATP
jgi:drug/metabolite transporter (DMT)-like permease